MNIPIQKPKSILDYLAYGFVLFLLLVFSLHFLPKVFGGETPDSLRSESEKLYEQAVRGYCEKMGTHVRDCYLQKENACEQLQTSAEWFTKEFGQSHTYLCNELFKLPFVRGE